MSRRRLVITADDLGRTEADTDVVLGLFADGAVSAVTLMPVGPAAERAAAAVRGRPGVWLHATLVSDADVPPWCPVADVPSLVDAGGHFHTDPRAILRAGSADVSAELRAQLGWLRERVGQAAGMDAHTAVLYGVHGGGWLMEALRLCAEERLGFRLPRDPSTYLQAAEVRALAQSHARAVTAADALGVPIPAAMLTNRRSAAEHGGYDALLASYLRGLAGLPAEGTSELFCHPGSAGQDDAATLRGWEARMLRDPRFTDHLAEEGFEVVPAWGP